MYRDSRQPSSEQTQKRSLKIDALSKRRRCGKALEVQKVFFRDFGLRDDKVKPLNKAHGVGCFWERPNSGQSAPGTIAFC